jgi:putative cell wall-binding protein
VSHPFVRARLVVVLVATFIASLLAVVGSPAVSEANTLEGRPAPAVWDATPVPGAIVPAGQIVIGGRGYTGEGITSVTVLLDGMALDAGTSDSTSTSALISATATVEAGDHVATVAFTDGSGAERRRDWRFTAADVPVTRAAGADRVATAATIARDGRQKGEAAAAVLARADDFADAIAGGPLAHLVDGPLLLTVKDALPDATAGALRDLVAPGGTVHLLGGTQAIGEQVERRIIELGYRIERHRGADRFGTAAAVAALFPPAAPAVVASGTSFPDALAVGGPAAAAGWPILLTAPTTLPELTRASLQGRDDAIVVGGQAVVSADVQAQVASAVAGDTKRVSGADRYGTAAEIARQLVPGAGSVALASGLDFADALVGSVHNATSGAALLLVRPSEVPDATAAYLTQRGVTPVRVFGGTRAIDDSTVNMAIAAMLDKGPRLTAAAPAFGTEINNLDQIQLTFDSSLTLEHTTISVWFAGTELPVSWAMGDFDNTLVLTLGSPPEPPALQRPTPLRVVVHVLGEAGWRHVDHTYTFRKIAMSRGDSGLTVQELQNQLIALGYWLGTPDANYGSLTVQAVMAFQKYERLPVTGTADRTTQERLAVAQRPRGSSTSGYVVEIDKTRQVLMLVRNGVAEWTFNTSTGTEKYYQEGGNSGTSNTPTGSFRVCREVNGLREAPLGTLWRPKYFECSRGIAVHGATSVPSYPASHGCVRVTYAAMDFIWAQNYMPIGTNVLVYGRYPGT